MVPHPPEAEIRWGTVPQPGGAGLGVGESSNRCCWLRFRSARQPLRAAIHQLQDSYGPRPNSPATGSQVLMPHSRVSSATPSVLLFRK